MTGKVGQNRPLTGSWFDKTDREPAVMKILRDRKPFLDAYSSYRSCETSCYFSSRHAWVWRCFYLQLTKEQEQQ